MKKITVLLALLLILCLLLICRQLFTRHAGDGRQKVPVVPKIEENLVLTSLLIQ